MRIQDFITSLSRPVISASGLVLILLLGIVDYVTGQEISFSIFYLLPISFGVWYGGRTAGLILSFAGAVIWLLADLLAGHEYVHILIPYWNAIMRLGFFLIVTYILMKLKSSRDRQEELSHFIVHDLRSPLSNVMTSLHLMKDVAGETVDAAQQELVEMSIISCNRMLSLINSLLDLASLESGYMPLKLREVNVRELTSSSFEQISVWSERNDVTLITEINEEAGNTYADPELTIRILVNLLGNAVKFSPPASKVTLRVVPAAGKKILFSIIDQGRGISPEWVGKVFDKFTQVEARKKGEVIGSGLGLTFCRLAVEAQGGLIWLESEVGKGTTISFELPASAPNRDFGK